MCSIALGVEHERLVMPTIGRRFAKPHQVLSLSLGLPTIGEKMCSTLLDVEREAQSADYRWKSARQHQVLSMRLGLLTVREMSLTMPSV